MWSARAMQVPPNGDIQYVILQYDNPVAFTSDQDFARLVIDLLETLRSPAFQEALALVAKRSNESEEPIEEPAVEVQDDDYEKKKAERLASLEEEEEE